MSEKKVSSNYGHIEKIPMWLVKPLLFLSQDIISMEKNWPKEDVYLINGRLIMILNHLASIYLKVQDSYRSERQWIIKSV